MKVRVTPRAGVLAFVCVLVLTFAVAPLRAYLGQRDQMATLSGQMRTLDVQNADLRSQATRLQDPTYLQQLARECLGMVRPGEIAFVTVPQHGKPVPPPC
jgi:cell division protein FtsB